MVRRGINEERESWYRKRIEDLLRELSDERDRYALLEERFLRSLGVSLADEVVTVQTPKVALKSRHRSWPERKVELERLDAARKKTAVGAAPAKRK